MIEGLKYIVVDTNILLIDAENLLQHNKIVVIPEVVIDEMDSKKSLLGSELGYQARKFSRLLSKAEVITINYDEHKDIKVSETLLKIKDCYVLFTAFSHYKAEEGRSYTNDRKILEVAKYYSEKNKAVFMSNDNAARLRAVSLGIATTEHLVVEEVNTEFTKEVTIEDELLFDKLDYKDILSVIPNHTQGTFNYIIKNPETTQVKLCYVDNGILHHISSTVEKDIRKNVDVAPINTQQIFLARALQDVSTDIVICEAKAGSGKTLVTLSNAIRMVKLGKYSGITYIRHSVDDVPKEEEVGFLSGNDEKMAVYFHPLYDSLEVIVRGKHKASKLKGKEFEDFITKQIEELMAECKIQPMTGLGLRGRTLTNQFVIIDEAQNPSASSMQKTLTRLGKGCKVAIIGSNKQIDNPYITKHNNGLSYLIDALRKTDNSGVKIYGVDLHKVVRSSIAEFAENLYSKEVK